MSDTRTPCFVCNMHHKGATINGHTHQDIEGVGNVRLLVIGRGKVEHCWRCGCVKSGWRNIPNDLSDNCSDNDCLCHTATNAS